MAQPARSKSRCQPPPVDTCGSGRDRCRPAASARRLPHAQRRRRGALRRQGARPEEARRVVLPEGRLARSAHPAHGGAGASDRDHGDALRGRSAAARKQPDQDPRAALQHPVPRRQVLSVPACSPAIAFPRLGFHRGALDKVNRYFGPFSSAGAVRESIQLLQKVFRLRTCEDTVFSNRSRPCLLHQIQRCTGAVRRADRHGGLRGGRAQRRAVPARARRRSAGKARAAACRQAARRQDYEAAAPYRDQIRALRGGAAEAVRQQRPGARRRHRGAGEQRPDCMCVNLVTMRAGRHRGDKSFFPEHAEGYDEAQALEAFLGTALSRTARCRR